MKYRFQIAGLLVLSLGAVVGAAAQMVASHAPTAAAASSPSFPDAAKAVNSGADASSLQVTGKVVVKVNGAELTDRDLLREMFALFPYAKLHGGFPKKQEAEIRQGAMQMIIFEELVYQEAVRRKMTIAPARVTREEHNFKGQFPSQAEFNEYLKTELGGSEAKLRQQIKRSLLSQTATAPLSGAFLADPRRLNWGASSSCFCCGRGLSRSSTNRDTGDSMKTQSSITRHQGVQA